MLISKLQLKAKDILNVSFIKKLKQRKLSNEFYEF